MAHHSRVAGAETRFALDVVDRTMRSFALLTLLVVAGAPAAESAVSTTIRVRNDG